MGAAAQRVLFIEESLTGECQQMGLAVDSGLHVVAYCSEEVSRQGHNVCILEGIERVGWMLNAWGYALCRREAVSKPSVEDAIAIGKLVEPMRNARGLRSVNVHVRTGRGIKRFPDHGSVREQLESLFGARDSMLPLEFYEAFEGVHPFVDGNGRSGKVLLNWLNGTLLAPVFPPNDLFGEAIRNP